MYMEMERLKWYRLGSNRDLGGCVVVFYYF